MGLSGNIITKSQGAAVILGATVTTAQLVPTPPLPPEENYCDDCRICMASCVAGFMDLREKTSISLGGLEALPPFPAWLAVSQGIIEFTYELFYIQADL